MLYIELFGEQTVFIHTRWYRTSRNKTRKVSDPKFNKTPAKPFTSPAKKKIDTSWAVIKTISLKLRHALRAGEVKRFQVSPCKSQEPISSGDPGRRGGKGEKGKTIDF